MSSAVFIELLGLLGIAASLIKLADLLLGERLKRAIQDRFDTLTLHLDSMDPMRWFMALSRPGPALSFSIFAGVFAWVAGPDLLGAALALLLDLWIKSGATLLGLEAPFSLSSLAPGFLLALPLSAWAIWKVSPRIVVWLPAHGVARFLLRMIAFYLCSAFIFLAFWSAARASTDFSALKWPLLALWPFLFGGYVVNASALLMFTFLIFWSH